MDCFVFPVGTCWFLAEVPCAGSLALPLFADKKMIQLEVEGDVA
jgi:hypothetical protein